MVPAESLASLFPVGGQAIKGLWQRETAAGLAANSIFVGLLMVIISWHHLGFIQVLQPPCSVVC